MLVSGAGSSWSAIQLPLPANLGTGVPANSYQLLGVHCVKKALTCVAVGSYPNQAGDYQAALLVGPPWVIQWTLYLDDGAAASVRPEYVPKRGSCPGWSVGI